MNDWKSNVFFVLVEPKEAGNIGASARAMKNMGFKNMELVKPRKFLMDEARQMACNAIDVLENAAVHADLKAAVKDKNIIIGTTRRIGKRRGLILPLNEGIKKAVSASKKNKIAILFGREDKGLNNKEVEECGFLITIPANPASASLNLSQSVLLVTYELSRKTYKTEFPELVKHKEIDGLYRRIRSTFRLLEYIPRGNSDLEVKIMRNLKRLIGRAGLTDWELKMLHGICSQVEKRIK
ncbi:MAG: RNA methyltransferase [Thermodesulfovibrionales bacterium]|nr:RNA methyltransferase [Thermodesulfovibrionales bacterium]